MSRKIAALVLTLCLFVPSHAFAGGGSRGEVVFTDALYGAAIGGLVGGAAWLIDQDSAGAKIGTGLVVGTVAGLVFGVAEAQSLVQVEDGAVKLALPTPVVAPYDGHLTYAVSLLHIPFD
ncbi:MAG TPA: hypothetical protein VGB12_13665 [bacterium]